MQFRYQLHGEIKNVKPDLASGLYIHSHDQRVLYFNPEPPDWITINERYKQIFDLFDGNHTLDSINSFIYEQYPGEREVLIPQIDEFVKTSNVLAQNQHKSRAKNTKDINAPELPKYIYITLTDRCNLRCKYCYAEERNKTDDADLDTWSRYVHDIISFAGTPIFIFTGGEPLLVPFVYDLAEIIQKAGCENILLTNGTQITTEDIANRVANLFQLVKLSLDTLDENVSSQLRGKGIVKKAHRAFNLLKDAGCNVQILATVTSMTSGNLDAFSKNFDNQVNFQPFYTMGRGRESSKLAVTGQEYYDALTHTNIFRLLPGFHSRIHGYRNSPFKRCAMAREEISLDSSGNVFPCHMLHYPELACGNLNSKSFSEIYSQSSVLGKLRNLDVDSMDQCKICIFRNICGGSCRARVDICKNGVDGVNEFCQFEKNAILDALMYSYG